VGIDIKTVWLWRLKLIIATANIPMPILSGIIQVDETFVRESQKGSRHLKSMVAQTEERKSRYGRQSSKFGVIGSEFATVVIAIENRGFRVCKVTSLGKLSTNVFYELFHDHLDSPAFLCSDANNIYEEYCCVNNTPHFIRPSNFLKIIGNHGYIIQATDEFEKKQINRYLGSSSMKNLTMENIRKFQIPLPPLEEQQRIATILDKFDTLVNSISEGLPKEIALRRKQYEYYREKLLSFPS